MALMTAANGQSARDGGFASTRHHHGSPTHMLLVTGAMLTPLLIAVAVALVLKQRRQAADTGGVPQRVPTGPEDEVEEGRPLRGHGGDAPSKRRDKLLKADRKAEKKAKKGKRAEQPLASAAAVEAPAAVELADGGEAASLGGQSPANGHPPPADDDDNPLASLGF